MMTKFKDFTSGTNVSVMENPSAQVTLKATRHTLYLRFNTKDVLEKASYTGSIDPWLSSLCSLSIGKTLNELTHLNWKNWDEAFASDQTYWDLKTEKADGVFFSALELLKTGLDVYRGQESLYKEPAALICRCFGVRENDVLDYIRGAEDPTPEGLATATKAGMGCRSCVPQLTKWLQVHKPKTQNHFYKEKPRAHWLLEIDYMLSCFPEAGDWKMEVQSFQGNSVAIKFDKAVSQKEEEEVGERLQDFLGTSLDADLGFFLIRA